MIIGIEKAAKVLEKKADDTVGGDVGMTLDRIAAGLAQDRDIGPLAADPTGRMLLAGGGAGIGGALGGAGGGLAGLLGHYVMADEKKRGLKNYLKSMLLGGLGGGVLGAGAGGLGAHSLASAVHEQQTPRGKIDRALDEARNAIGL